VLTDLLLHDKTKRLLESFASNPTHALILSAPEGAGKHTLSLHLAANILEMESEELLFGYPYFLNVKPQKGSITIAQIRELQDFLSLKTLGSKPLRRVMIVEDAHLMTPEAQNAFLKTLEEPPADTVIIMTVQNNGRLLSTVRSRCLTIPISSPAESAALSYFDQYSEQAVKRAYALSGGHVGLLVALLENADEHELAQAVAEAKILLRKSSFERLVEFADLPKDQEYLNRLLDSLKRISKAALAQAAKSNNKAQLMRMHRVLVQLQRSEVSLSRRSNSKLLITDLFLNL
jgi:DNA polymerase III delta prime subunit